MNLLIEWESMKKASDLSGAEVIEAMNAGDIRAKIRFIFSTWSARIETASLQQTGLPPIEMRRMELQAAEAIIAAILGATKQ